MAVKTNKVSFRTAQTHEDYISCFKLLHDVYADAGFIQPSPIQIRVVPHHFVPGAVVVMGMVGDELAYTASVFPDSERGLPMDTEFKLQLDGLRSQGRKLVEIGCLVSALNHRGDNLAMAGNREVVRHVINTFNADDMVITTHPKYLKVYEDMLLFERLGEIESFDYVSGNPAVALRLDINTWEDELEKKYGHLPGDRNLRKFFFG